MGAASMSTAARVGAGSASPVDEEYEFLRCGVRKQGNIVPSEGIRGSRSRLSEAVTQGLYTVGGPLVMEPRPDDLDNWLPRILGGTETADNFPLAETIPEFYFHVEKVATSSAFEYAGCKVASAVFRSSKGQNLTLELDVQGKTRSASAFPDIAASLSDMQPYIHHQAVVTLDSTAREVDNLEIRIDNGLILDRHYNSQSRVSLPEGDRIITVSFDSPFTADETDLLGIAIAGISGTIVYTNGSYSLTFTFGNLKASEVGPEVPGRGQEIPLRLELQAFKTDAGTMELSVDNVPA